MDRYKNVLESGMTQVMSITSALRRLGRRIKV
jgi:hypothetical protein